VVFNEEGLLKARFVALTIFLLFLVILLGSVYVPPSVHEKPRVVAIRIDDVQDYFLDEVQSEVLGVFLSSNVRVSLAVIPGCFGNDSRVVSVVREGVNRGLFEIAVHGWMHENFSRLSYEDQFELMSKSVERLKTIFPSTEIGTFVPPWNSINNDTLRAAEKVGFRIVSSTLENNPYFRESDLKHLPENVETAFLKDEKWVKNSVEDIREQTQNSVSKYGYAVLLVHPQQFAKYEGKELLNEVDEDSLEWLNELLLWLSTNYEAVCVKDLEETRLAPALRIKCATRYITVVGIGF